VARTILSQVFVLYTTTLSSTPHFSLPSLCSACGEHSGPKLMGHLIEAKVCVTCPCSWSPLPQLKLLKARMPLESSIGICYSVKECSRPNTRYFIVNFVTVFQMRWKNNKGWTLTVAGSIPSYAPGHDTMNSRGNLVYFQLSMWLPHLGLLGLCPTTVTRQDKYFHH
jgi:hypothetical protein